MNVSRLLRPAAIALLASGFCAAIPGSTALANHPEPSPYPLSTAWYLDFKHGTPKRIVVDVPGEKVPQAYWYLTYSVINNTGKEVDFWPEFEMVTQDGQIHRSDRGVPLEAFTAIKKSEGNDLLLPATQVAGTIHQGEDQAKDGVAIWREPMPRMGEFSIFAAGLNSESVFVNGENGKPLMDASGQPVMLRKELELDYVIYGDEIKPELDEVHFKGEKSVMR